MAEYNATWLEYCQAIESILRFYMVTGGKTPEYICVPYKSPTECTNKFYQKDWENAMQRVQGYIATNGTLPPNVWFRNLTPSKTAFHQKVESAVGTYSNFTEYYNRIKAKTWEGYYNDVYGLEQEIQRLAGNKSLNCTDHSQLGFAVSSDMGYEALYCRVTCKSGGHIILKVRGKELGSNWVNVDLAAAASSDYNIGSYWCSSYAKPVVINESWINLDDGIT